MSIAIISVANNTVILVSLIAIVLAFIVGLALGTRDGLKRGENRIMRRFFRYTVSTKRRAPDGSVYSVN